MTRGSWKATTPVAGVDAKRFRCGRDDLVQRNCGPGRYAVTDADGAYQKVIFTWPGDTPVLRPERDLRWTRADTDRVTFERTVEAIVRVSRDRHDQWTLRTRGIEAAVASIRTPDPEHFIVDSQIWEVAWDGDALVGLVQPLLYRDDRRDGRPMGTIGYIGVVPEQRGKGYAYDLLARVTRYLVRAGVWRIFCDTDTENAPMIAAFERFGYARGRIRELPLAGLALMARTPEASEFRVETLLDNRGAICREILRELPDWFGIPEAIEEYAAFADGAPMLVAVRNGIIGGFVVLRDTSDAACEMHVIAVRPALHRLGLGRSLVAAAEAATNETGRRYLTVKTIGPSRRDAAYERTRQFYVAMGFVAIEEFADLWDGNPCLLMLKALPPPCHPELVEGQREA